MAKHIGDPLVQFGEIAQRLVENNNRLPAGPSVTVNLKKLSANVEKLAMGADIIVHSFIQPMIGPDKNSRFPPPIYFRQSTATDLGAMAERANAKHLMLTHLFPPLGAKSQGSFPVPGGALTNDDYKCAAAEGGFTGNTIVGPDLISLQLPQ